MTLASPVNFCAMCGDQLIGRADKIFCSLPCKNYYHRTRKQQHNPFSEPIDKILHRNWVILQENFEKAGSKKKIFLSKAHLKKEGFHTQYYTTSQINNANKTYYYVYNLGWMDFSTKEIMVVRLAKSK